MAYVGTAKTRKSKIIEIDGRDRAYTDGDEALYTDLPAREQTIIFDWIRIALQWGTRFNTHHTSYGLKHILEADTGIYLSNNQFKDVMLASGFYPHDEKSLNWSYRISEKSPCFKKLRKQQEGYWFFCGVISGMSDRPDLYDKTGGEIGIIGGRKCAVWEHDYPQKGSVGR